MEWAAVEDVFYYTYYTQPSKNVMHDDLLAKLSLFRHIA